MRDARSGGGKSKPHLISEHGAGQHANQKPRTISQQLSHYSSSQRKYDSPQAERKRRQAQARLTSPKNVERLLRQVPSFGSAVDSLGQNTIGLGMVRPSRMPGNILHNLGLGAHGLPTDERPAGLKFKRALTTDEFHRYQKTGVPPFDAIKGQVTIGMVPFVPGGASIRHAAWGDGPHGIPKGPGMPRTNADLEKIARPAVPEGTLFHGSPEGDLSKVDALHHTKGWREGPGFYLTSSFEKAQKYAKGKTAKGERNLSAKESGAVNAYKLKPGTRVLDLEKRGSTFWRKLAEEMTGEKISPKLYETWARDAREQRGASTASPGVLGRMGLMEFLTGYHEMPHTDAYYAIEDALHNRGVQATRHIENGVPVHVIKDASVLERVHLPTPQESAISALKKAPAAYREQKGLRSEELGKRVQKGSKALAEGTGDQAFHAFFHELKGPLPRTQYNALSDLSEEQVAHLKEHIRTHGDLTDFEKGTAWKAFQDAYIHRKVPPPHAQKILERAFGPEVSRELFHPSNFRGHLKHVVIETVNVPRAVMSSLDMSAPMRQGLVGLISHPVISSKELGPMVRAFASEKYYRDWRANQLEKDPYYERALKDRLAATDIEHSLANREEPYQSNYAERIPGVGHVVRSSGRAYNRFLVGQRFGIYKHLAQHAEDVGRSLDEVGKNGQTLGEQIASLSGDATGRGQGRRGGFFERNAVELNAALFSPRLIKSRLDFLNPLAYHNLDPLVRAEKMKMAVKTVASISTFLYAMSRVPGVKVQVDPRSSDFGKIRIGNTRIDVGGGFNQYIRVLAQAVANGEVDVNTGEVKHGHTLDVLTRFGRGKLSPAASAGTDLLLRTNYAGQPLNWKQEVAGRAFPLSLQDAKNVLDQTHSLPAAAAAYGGSAVGLGVQAYGPPKATSTKTTEDLRTDLRASVRHYFHRGLTPQLHEALKLRETRENYMKKVLPKRPGRGATDAEKATYALHRFNAQVDLMVKLGKINRGQARKAKSWARSADRHKVNSETSRVGRKYFGGDALTDAAKKIREKGGHLYLGDY